MIFDLIGLVQKQLGYPLPPHVRIVIAAALAERYGGRRLYVPVVARAPRKGRPPGRRKKP